MADEDVRDLRQRLRATRWAEDYDNHDWRYGVPGDYLRELVDHWATGFDWRQEEASINNFPQYRTVLDGVQMHFMWRRSGARRNFPLLLLHGWPWTFWDFSMMIPHLVAGDGAAGFDVVVPSLPGYPLSCPLRRAGVSAQVTADLAAKLMRILGYSEFGAVGCDWGAHVAANLAHAYPERTLGVYLTTCAVPGLDPSTIREGDFETDEADLGRRALALRRAARAHVLLNRDTPQTLAWALNDSPAGLAAWLIEKRRSWSGRDKEFEDRFSREFLLTTVSLYWFSGAVHSAARLYADSLRHPWLPRHDRTPLLQAPVGIGVFPFEPGLLPRRVMARYANLVHWHVMPRGGHFAAAEEPELFAADVRQFFRRHVLR